MKYCPNCQTTYADESLRFCLHDGAILQSYKSESSQMPTEVFGETETVVRQNRTPSAWEQSQVTRLAAIKPESKKSNAPVFVIVAALTMCVFFAGVAGFWLLLSGGLEDSPYNINISSSPTPTATITPNGNIKEKIQIGTGWEPIDYGASLNGENLTYYPGTTIEQCQADCEANPKCRGFTFIRAGAYNPNDSQMCYLASKVTGSAAHSCCISAVKSENGRNTANIANPTETFTACDYFLGSGLYDKWKQMGGESGKLGCPVISEAEAEPSPQGTTGRYTRFTKGDGGYIIWHGSGRFSGTSFEVSGCMFKLYYDIGGTRSWLGFPVKDGFTTPTGARQDFEGGYILWDSKTYVCQAYRDQ